MNDQVIKAAVDQAKHEWRFLWRMLAAVMVLSFLVIEPLTRIYDEHVRSRPLITALVEIVPAHEGKPYVRYATLASLHLTGKWSAWVSENGVRGCGGHGKAGYGPPAQAPRLWEWAEWIGRDCAVPDGPFSLCVRYAVQTSAGVGDIAGPFCSEIYVREELE